MNTSTIILLSILGILLTIFIFGLMFVIFTKKPTPGNCDNIKSTQPDVLWNEDCSFVSEKSPDGTLKIPKNPLYLVNFTSSPSFGPPLGANVWYRYRYVNGKTGGYSLFSPWTKSPIIAGGRNLPCKDGDCSGIGNSCQSNIVRLGIEKLDYDISSDIYANVHRVVLPPGDGKVPFDNSEDEIVGYLTPSSGTSWEFVDLSETPCNKIICNRPGC